MYRPIVIVALLIVILFILYMYTVSLEGFQSQADSGEITFKCSEDKDCPKKFKCMSGKCMKK